MTILAATASAPAPIDDLTYEPGVCNIGPAEIARRRRSGITATVATIGLLAILLGVHAPTPVRLLLFVPAAIAAAGFLQARLQFCAGFGWLGVFNFREVGITESVSSLDARRRDRFMATRIGLASALTGAIVGAAAALLPA